MKTIIDAVKDLKGDINNVIVNDFVNDFVSIILCYRGNDDFTSEEYYNYNREHSRFLSGNLGFICTVDEFNACVDELSAATWIDGISLEEWKAEMKNTVIDSHGNGMEIGKVYEFSKDELDWFFSRLLEVESSKVYKYKTDNGFCNHIRESKSPLGTIKKAPVKLVDGKAYQFESVATGRVWVGFYNSTNDRFDESVGGDGSHCFIGDVSDFKNIIPLVTETK